jgi:hypothetical protein
VAGTFVEDRPGAAFALEQFLRQIDLIHQAGGTPLIFQSFGLTAQDDLAMIKRYVPIARRCDRFMAFELGTMFAPLEKSTRSMPTDA